MYHQSYQDDSYCRVTSDAIEYYSLDVAKSNHKFDRPSCCFSHDTLINAKIIINNKVICQTVFKDRAYQSRFTFLGDLSRQPLKVRSETPVVDFIVNRGKRCLVYSTVNQVFNLSFQGETERIAKIPTPYLIMKIKKIKSRIYVLAESKGHRAFFTIDTLRKQIVDESKQKLDFVVSHSQRLISLDVSDGNIKLDGVELQFEHESKNDKIFLDLVQVKDSQDNRNEIVLITHKLEPNYLYYRWKGVVRKVRLENALRDLKGIYRVTVNQHHGILEYKVFTVKQREEKVVINTIQLYPSDTRYLILNMKYLFSNGMVQPHFQEQIHRLYRRKYTNKFPFLLNDRHYKKSIDNSYQLFKILVVNFSRTFISIYKNKPQNFENFSDFIEKFASEILYALQHYRFAKRHVEKAQKLFNKLHYFYTCISAKYLNHLVQVHNNKNKHKEDSIRRNFQNHRFITSRLQDISLSLKILRMGITKSQIHQFFTRHAEAKNRLESSVYYPHFKITPEHFRGYRKCLEKQIPTRQQFISSLMNIERYALVYIAYCMFGERIEKQLRLSKQDVLGAQTLYNLTFSNTTKPQQAVTSLINNGSAQALYYPLVHLLLIHEYNDLAYKVVYSLKTKVEDISLFADVNIKNDSVKLGYFKLSSPWQRECIFTKSLLRREYTRMNEKQWRKYDGVEKYKRRVQSFMYLDECVKKGRSADIVETAIDVGQWERKIVEKLVPNAKSLV